MNKMVKFSLFAMLLCSLAFTLNSCDKEFDAPPAPADPAMVANTTIAALKALHQTAGAYDIINSDLIIEGTIVADDRSGNLYKQLVIEDATGGIQLLVDATSLYGSYPVGRKVFIKAQGLCISDYNNTPQLGVKAIVAGAPSLEGIPGSLLSKYLVGGSLNNPVVPHAVTFAELDAAGSAAPKPWLNRYLNTVIQLNGYAFENLNDTYSDTSAYKQTVNRTIRNCPDSGNNSIIIRTSAYANFAGKRVAQGRGKVNAVYTIFNTTKQLILRDSTDVQFTNAYECPLPPGTLLFQNFETQVTPGPISIANWFIGAEAGSRAWEGRLFNSNRYAQMSAFGSNEASNVGWMVTKGVNLGSFTTKTLSFESIAGFHNGATLKVLASTNYTGTGNPWAAGVTWTDITSQATLSPGLPSGYPTSFTPSGNVSLNSFSGTIYIAFKYEGADPSGTSTDKTTTWQIDNIRILAN